MLFSFSSAQTKKKRRQRTVSFLKPTRREDWNCMLSDCPVRDGNQERERERFLFKWKSRGGRVDRERERERGSSSNGRTEEGESSTLLQMSGRTEGGRVFYSS